MGEWGKRRGGVAPVRVWIRVCCLSGRVCECVCVCVGLRKSVRKLNFDFALMLRYGILGQSNQLMVKTEGDGEGNSRVFNLFV